MDINLDKNWKKRMEVALSEDNVSIMVFQKEFPIIKENKYPVVCIIKNRDNMIKMFSIVEPKSLYEKYSFFNTLKLIITDDIKNAQMCLENKIKCIYIKNEMSILDITRKIEEV